MSTLLPIRLPGGMKNDENTRKSQVNFILDTSVCLNDLNFVP